METLPKSLRPMNDRVLVEPIKPEDTTKGGIIIPDNAKERPNEGIVILVGRGRLLENGGIAPLDVQPGDKVLMDKYAGTELKINGKDYLVVSEANIIGVITD
jgi:chaperonin GroES